VKGYRPPAAGKRTAPQALHQGPEIQLAGMAKRLKQTLTGTIDGVEVFSYFYHKWQWQRFS
jgi:hypothetical protein